MNPNVLERIVASDGWIARPTCPPNLIAVDLAEIEEGRAAAGVSDRPFTMAHENFVYIVEDGTPEEITAQAAGGLRDRRRRPPPWDYIEAVYLNGTIKKSRRWSKSGARSASSTCSSTPSPPTSPSST